MAAQLPDKLRKADLQRFALRAAQLEKARPIVAYWCEYYLLQHILGKQLHVGDDTCSDYAVGLMDKLEATKASNASNDAIVDDVAAKAYIENFALETFTRADESQRANKVTKQTADTFMAAATFMDLLSIWGVLDSEITAKSKFAKYHARRILQALKAGQDPNATNPVVEQPAPLPIDDSIEAELNALEHQQREAASSNFRAATVDDVAAGIGLTPGAEASMAGGLAAPPTAPQHSDFPVSPLEPAEESKGRQGSVGGGYFPTTPAAADAPMDGDASTAATAAPIPPPTPPDMDPLAFYNTAAPAPPEQPSAPSPAALGISSPARPGRPTPDQMTAQPPAIPPVQSPLPPPQIPTVPTQAPSHIAASAPAPAPVHVPAHVAPQPQPPVPVATTGFRTDDDAVMAAQKHARWAISALNFEDVNTAVKELRLALQSLGAG